MTVASLYIAKCQRLLAGSNAGYISQEVANAAGTHTKQVGLTTVCIQPLARVLAHEDLRKSVPQHEDNASFQDGCEVSQSKLCCDIK